jgi:hypothetical protein
LKPEALKRVEASVSAPYNKIISCIYTLVIFVSSDSNISNMQREQEGANFQPITVPIGASVISGHLCYYSLLLLAIQAYEDPLNHRRISRGIFLEKREMIYQRTFILSTLRLI